MFYPCQMNRMAVIDLTIFAGDGGGYSKAGSAEKTRGLQLT
jgi:hypothetical protein